MKPLLVYLSILTILCVCCFSIPKGYRAVNGKIPNHPNTDCSELYTNIKKRWVAYPKFTCFYYERQLLDNIIANTSCFIGLQEDEIIALFGSSSRNEYNLVEYNLAKDCKNATEQFGDYSLRFYMVSKDGSRVVSSVKLDKVQVSH